MACVNAYRGENNSCISLTPAPSTVTHSGAWAKRLAWPSLCDCTSSSIATILLKSQNLKHCCGRLNACCLKTTQLGQPKALRHQNYPTPHKSEISRSRSR